jgi:hypothetical protein
MEMDIDIPEVVNPIIRKTRKIENIKSTKQNAELIAEKHKIEHLLTEFILLVEGFYKYIPNLKKDKAAGLLADTKNIIPKFDSMDEHLKQNNYLDDAAFKEKFRYALKVLYKLKSLLHIAYTRDFPVQKTPAYIKEGLARVSTEAVAYKLSR